MKEYYARLSPLTIDMDEVYSNPSTTKAEIEKLDKIKKHLNSATMIMIELLKARGEI